MTREEMKEVAIHRLRQMGIYAPYIRAFSRKTKPCLTGFIEFAGYWCTEENGGEWGAIARRAKEIEAEYNCLVYAVTRTSADMTEYLVVFEDDESADLERYGRTFYAMAFVDSEFPEFGTIGLASMGGGLKRVA